MKKLSFEAIFAMLLAAWLGSPAVAQNDAAKQRISIANKSDLGYTISKETTYFTGPLKKDGSVDFLAAVNAHFSQGVTPENNAARVIVPLLDPLTWSTDSNHRRDDVLRALGLDPAKCDVSNCLVELNTFAKSTKLNEDSFQRQYITAMERPWTADEFPELARWVSENERALARITEATRRERFYVPFVATDSDSLIQVLLEHIQQARSVARFYSVRVNLNLANGRWKEAWNDILTIKNLGGLVGQGPTLVEGLVGVAITGVSCQSAVQFIEEFKADEVDWAELLESWEPRRVADVAESIGVSERAMFLQLACQVRNDSAAFERSFGLNFPGGEAPMANKLIVSALKQMLQSSEVKLDDALRYSNSIYDRFVTAVSITDIQERNEALAELEKSVGEMAVVKSAPGQSPAADVLGVLFAPPQDPHRQFADVLLAQFVPALTTIVRAQTRVQSSQQVVELALAARLVQARTSHLPGSPRELEPLVSAENFIQPSTGDPIAFRFEDRAIVIYHWSADRKDDGGDISGANPRDWGIRIRE